ERVDQKDVERSAKTLLHSHSEKSRLVKPCPENPSIFLIDRAILQRLSDHGPVNTMAAIALDIASTMTLVNGCTFRTAPNPTWILNSPVFHVPFMSHTATLAHRPALPFQMTSAQNITDVDRKIQSRNLGTFNVKQPQEEQDEDHAEN